MFRGRTIYKFLISFGLLLILTTCSVEKNTGTTRFYHGLTARFNIYFNGYESFKAGLVKINNGFRDDYSELLKVFEFSDPATAQFCSSDMEKAIQKASKLISLKSITAKPEFDSRKDLTVKEKALLEQKEFNEWVDDSYFLIARARFYKHEFNEATSVFNYCVNEANDPEIKTESVIWLARINNETGSYIESNRLLSELEITAATPKLIRAMYYTTLADLNIKQKKFDEAIEPLTTSLEFMAGKRTKYRLTYLLAQLYERAGNASKATELYGEVVKMNPPYDVEFNARINIAGVFDVNSGDPLEIRKELERMLKDSKNKDFQDQIYYALGNMMLKEGNEEEAIKYYRKSASSVSINTSQKAKSYLALADYFYKKPDYMNAGKFYDSTVYFIDQKFPDYKELNTKSQNLNALVREMTIIQTEDSLQKVAAMPENQRDALITGIIDKIIKDESEGRVSEYAARANIGQYYENERRFEDNISQEGKWYFYNQAALTFGRTEFRRRWGDRRLEDNWRRSNKARVNVQQTAGADENGKKADTAVAVLDYKKPEFYLKNLPLNDSLLALSNEKIATAYFYSGEVFSEKISNPRKAAESYEALLKRFPTNELVPETLYNLYRVLKEVDKVRSETYRQRLLSDYPSSEYSKILSDPEYYNKLVAGMKAAETLYENAYTLYTRENFIDAINICDSALTNHPQDALAPKFMLLHSYSVARISDERSFKDDLTRLIKKYPDTDEAKKAEGLIAYLNEEIPELKIEEDKQIAVELYVADTIPIHSFVLIIMDPSFNINQASFDVISYNIDNYTNKNYRTVGRLIDGKFIMITVTGFTGNNLAREYFNSFYPDKLLRNPTGAKTLTFLINSENLKTLEQDRNPERYYLFFNEKYISWQKNR